MYPSRFRYEAPRSMDEALDLLRAGDGEAKVLAGGQSLVPLLKLRFASPEMLVDINGLPGLGLPPGRPGRHDPRRRAVPARGPGGSALLADRQPTMAAAAPLVADPIVRNRGTWSGSLATRTRRATGRPSCSRSAGEVVAQRPRRARDPDHGVRQRAVPDRAQARRDRGRDPGAGARPGTWRRLRRRWSGRSATSPPRRGGAVHPGRRHVRAGRHRADRRGLGPIKATQAEAALGGKRAGRGVDQAGGPARRGGRRARHGPRAAAPTTSSDVVGT